MISATMVQEVRRLLLAGCTYRQIARITGVSRNTIGVIARGGRGADDDRAPSDYACLRPETPPERCPTCGGLVYPPCQLCRVRRHLARQQARATGSANKRKHRRKGAA